MAGCCQTATDNQKCAYLVTNTENGGAVAQDQFKYRLWYSKTAVTDIAGAAPKAAFALIYTWQTDFLLAAQHQNTVADTPDYTVATKYCSKF